MIFNDRLGTNLNRKRIKIISQTPTEIIADVERADTVTQEGTKINASVFNAFQASIDEAKQTSTTALTQATTALTNATQATLDATEALSQITSATTNASTALTTANSANTTATSALTKANTNATSLNSALTRIQSLENGKATFSLSGTTLNITTN